MKITICRLGTINHSNIKAKGSFVREFDSIESFVRFFYDNRRVFFYPYIKKELSKEELSVVANKSAALFRNMCH